MSRKNHNYNENWARKFLRDQSIKVLIAIIYMLLAILFHIIETMWA